MCGPKEPDLVFTAHLFPELLRKSWTVHDVALHLLGVDIGLRARERNGFVISNINVASRQELVEALT